MVIRQHQDSAALDLDNSKSIDLQLLSLELVLQLFLVGVLHQI
jgi:hypothetical protein